jgi:hypothetical protein
VPCDDLKSPISFSSDGRSSTNVSGVLSWIDDLV